MALIKGSAGLPVQTTVDKGGHWLKNPVDPTDNLALFVLAGPHVKRRRRQGEHLPLASSNVVVVADIATGTITIDLTLFAPTDQDRADIEARKNKGGPFFYQDSQGHQWYVHFRGELDWQPADFAADKVVVQVSFVRVEQPV